MADFYTVRQAAQPQQNRPNPGGRIPPPPPMPARQQINPQGGGGIPPPPPMMPQGQHQGQHQGQQGPPPPAMHQIPPQVRQRPLVEISDIRRERRTEADYRDDLTEYFVYRFEKVLTEDGYDSDGDKIKATWENCLRTRVTDISKKVAAREIQNLNKYSDSLADKKKSLNPAQQRQLEKALQELSSQDNDERFEFTLVQIDHQLKPVDKPEKKSKKKDVSGKKRSRDNKKKYQRISITAYYKRAPLPTINAQQLVRDIQLAAQQAAQQAQQRAFLLHQQQQQQQQHMAAQQAQHQAQHQAQQQQQQQPRVYPMNNQNGRHPGQGQGRHPQDRRDPRYHGGSASSDHSSWSDDESGSEGSTVITEPSRSSRDSYERRRRSPKYIEESPKHYGINNGPTRRHTKDGDENRIYVVSGSPPAPEPPRPPRMIAPAENLERIKRNAYEEGRADQRDDDLRAEIEAARYQPRIAPRPAIVQRPNLIRHVTSSEVDRQLYDDEYRLANLSVNDPRRSVELLYPDEIDDIRREEARRRRAAEARFRMEEEESLILEQEAILRERAAQDYMRRRETSPPNPFAPLRRHYYD